MPYFLQFLVICIMVVLGCAKVTLQGFASRAHIRSTADSFLFNAQLFLVISVVMAILFPLGLLSPAGIAMAAMTAVGTVAFQAFYALALQTGPVSLTVLFVNFALFFVTAFSVITYREPVYLTQLLGIVFLLVSMLLGVKKSSDEKGISGKWIVYMVIVILANSASSIFMKIFTKEMSAEFVNSQNSFMSLSYLIASFLAFATYFLIAHTGKREGNTYGFFNRHVLLYVLLIGVILGIYQKFYLLGMEKIDGGFMFPTYSGMQSLGMTVIGILLFKDKLSKRQIFGVIAGIFCVVLMNVRWGLLF